MKVLITGSKGGIGQLLVPILIEGKEEVRELNLNNKTRADRIIHLAASSASTSSRNIIDSNIFYLKQVVSYALENQIPEFIFFSSVDVYGDLDEENASESSPIICPSLYGISKLFGEKYVETAPLMSLSLRLPGVLTLTNNSNVFGRIFDQLQMGKPINVTNPEKLFNGYITVDSLAAFLQKVRLTKANDCINLAARRDKTLRQLVVEMHGEIGSRSSIHISEKKKRFLNVSTDRAEKYYQFTPERWEDYVPGWLEKRVNNVVAQKVSG